MFKLPALDETDIAELISIVREDFNEVEITLDHLSKDPQNSDIINDVFRNLHSIKGNLRVCFFGKL